ncbi:hypothetical protein Bca101_012301 [Brassica carinata]
MEIVLFLGVKQHWWMMDHQLIMTIILVENIRKTVIIIAGRSFTHLIKIRQKEHHMPEGVYQVVRNLSHSAFLIWSVGTQVMLCNLVSAIAVAIEYLMEEHYSKQLGRKRQYVEYANS